MRGGARVNSGPLPKDAASRRRRNAGPSMVELPRDGRQGDAPDWPLPGTPDEAVAVVWDALWAKPQAAAWESGGFEHVVARLALLTVAALSDEASAAVLGEVRQLEDRLGLNPAALQRLRWKLAEAEEEAAEVVPIAPRERRVKAVE
ncbi:phage terminase small subunit [Nocardiopsis trehalosi]|uniref:phage terminase small subunit n=1 Tax=Nocardiopsis trehalosi TaxID=109329 RepID=UPI0008340B3D|nr:hypothetical protein [Nocardiopsis trehalosi]